MFKNITDLMYFDLFFLVIYPQSRYLVNKIQPKKLIGLHVEPFYWKPCSKLELKPLVEASKPVGC